MAGVTFVNPCPCSAAAHSLASPDTPVPLITVICAFVLTCCDSSGVLCADSLSEGVWLGVPSADVDSPAVALCDDCEAVPDALSPADEEDEPCEVCAVVCVRSSGG